MPELILILQGQFDLEDNINQRKRRYDMLENIYRERVKSKEGRRTLPVQDCRGKRVEFEGLCRSFAQEGACPTGQGDER